MSNRPTSIDDIAESISDLSTMIAKAIAGLEAKMDRRFTGVEMRLDGVEGRLDRVEGRLDGVEMRLTSVEAGQRDMSQRLERVENKTQALHNDVIELYSMAR